MYLKVVDRYNEQVVSAFVTPGSKSLAILEGVFSSDV